MNDPLADSGAQIIRTNFRWDGHQPNPGTTLNGNPDDFKDENFIRLLTNGLAWATKSEWKAK